MERPPLVAAVVVHFGAADRCVECLASLRESAKVRVLPILVDNNPQPDPGLEGLATSAGGRYLSRPDNPGFAGGANAGVRLAREAAPRMIVLLNADVRLEPRCLEHLEAALSSDPRAGVVGPGLLSARRPGEWWNVGTEIDWPAARPRSLRHGDPEGSGAASGFGSGSDSRREAEVDFICGAALAFRPELLDAVGYLPESYYLYYEDADFCSRVRRAGLSVAVVPVARAWHWDGASFVGREARRVYYQARNRLFFSRRWNPHRLRGGLHRFAFALEALWRAFCGLPSSPATSLAYLRALADYARGRSGRMRDGPT